MLILKGARVPAVAVQKQDEPKKKKKRSYHYILKTPSTRKQPGWQEDTTVDIEQMDAALEAARTRIIT